MSYCDNCLHREVCGIENAGDESMTYCCDKVGWIQVSERLPEIEEKDCVFPDIDYNIYR